MTSRDKLEPAISLGEVRRIFYVFASMAQPGEQPAKADWQGLVALLIVFVLLGLLLAAASARLRKPQGFTITLKEIVTNSAGMPEVLVEVQNHAGDVWLDPKVQVAASERRGTTNRAGFRTLQNTLRPPWTSMDVHGDTVKYHLVEAFTNLDTQVHSTTGTNLLKGQVTALRFEAPANDSFRLLVDCWRLPVPPKSAWRLRMEKWNAAANAKLGIPIIFESGTWMHQQLAAPLVPKGALTNRAGLHSLGRPMENPL